VEEPGRRQAEIEVIDIQVGIGAALVEECAPARALDGHHVRVARRRGGGRP